MSDTPRTDTFYQAHPICEYEQTAHPTDCDDWLDFARQLERELAAANEKVCTHGWKRYHVEEQISTPCPACGLHSLFIGNGGHLTCASVPGQSGQGGCSNPSVENVITDLKKRIAELEKNLSEEHRLRAELSDDLAFLKYADEEEILEAKKDAARYRWLRVERFDADLPTVQSTTVGCIGCDLTGDELDAAIDAAMKERE